MTLRSFYRFVFVGTLYTFAAIAVIDVFAWLSGFDLANAGNLAAFHSRASCNDCAFAVKLPIWSGAIWLVP